MGTDHTDLKTDNQVNAEKTYSQQEVNDMMARMKGSLQKKLLKPYEELGDPDELRTIKTAYEQKQQEEAMKRGEFETILKDLAAKKDSEIQKRDSVIKEYKVNTPLLDAAARYRSVNPEQVKALLASNVRLNQEGDVDVVDSKGKVRYNDAGNPITVDDLVKEFLETNPHFVQSGSATTNTKSTVSNSNPTKAFELDSLDLTNPEHRKLYKEAKQKGLF